MKKPIVEVVDTEKEFKWRLVLDDEKSEWYSNYSGILVHIFKDGRKFACTTNYFAPQLPEIPNCFQIVE
jgi:hypothetical protein